jgi:hypothetical protein
LIKVAGGLLIEYRIWLLFSGIRSVFLLIPPNNFIYWILAVGKAQALVSVPGYVCTVAAVDS